MKCRRRNKERTTLPALRCPVDITRRREFAIINTEYLSEWQFPGSNCKCRDKIPRKIQGWGDLAIRKTVWTWPVTYRVSTTVKNYKKLSNCLCSCLRERLMCHAIWNVGRKQGKAAEISNLLLSLSRFFCFPHLWLVRRVNLKRSRRASTPIFNVCSCDPPQVGRNRTGATSI